MGSSDVKIEPLLLLLAEAGGQTEMWEDEWLAEIKRAGALGLVRSELTGGFQGASQLVMLTNRGRARMGLAELPEPPRVPFFKRLLGLS